MALPRISVSIKLYSLVLVTSCVILGIGIYGTMQLRTMEQNTKIIFFDELLSLDYLTTMRFSYNDGIQNTIRLYYNGNIDLDSAKSLLKNEQRKIDSNWSAYKQTYLTPPEIELIKHTNPMIVYTDTLINKLLEGDLDEDDTADLKSMNASIARLMPNLQSLIKLQVTVSDEFYQKNQKVYQTTSKHFKALVVGALLFAIILYIFIVRDTHRLIYNLEKSNARITESEEKYRYLFNHNPAFIIIWDPVTMMVLEVNDMIKSTYGYSTDEWKQMSVLQYRPEEDRPLMLEFARQINEGLKRTTKRAWRHIMKNGETRYMDITSHSIIYAGRAAVLSLAEDVTDKHLAEEKITEMNARIKGLYEHIQTAREEERACLAREIHDELGQYLTVLKMEVASIDKKIAPQQANMKERFEQVYAHIDLTVKNVRRIISNLRPPVLDDLGVTAAIEWHLAGIRQRMGINCALVSGISDIEINPNTAITIYRIYQEAVTNVLKHAKATALSVALKLRGQYIEMTITDNGIGFDTTLAGHRTTYGILGMRERAATAGGGLTIESAPGKGCTVTLRIPLNYQTT